jgi:uncharacterized protein (DUF2342 family)
LNTYIGAGDNVLIAAPGAGYSISIISMYLSANGTEVASLSQGGTVLFNSYMINGVPHVLPECSVSWAKAAENTAVLLTLTNGGVDVYVDVVYQAVPSHQEY